MAEPYAIAYDAVSEAENVFLRIKTDAGLQGYGCSGPDVFVTGETPASVLAEYQRIEGLLLGEDALDDGRLRHRLTRELAKAPAALAGVDMALYDLLGKHCGLPLWRLLGGYRSAIATSVTIGILPLEATLDSARRWQAAGFQSLKLKGGQDWQSDAERVTKVREVVGAGIELRFDANQGFSAEDALRFLAAAADADIALIEQPTPFERLDLLAQVTAASSVPIMADESLKTLADAMNIAARRCAHQLNIKLMKVGGITAARQFTSIAAGSGLGVMVGCMDEAALAIAAGLHLALASPEIGWADLDGHIGLIGDPSDGAVRCHRGILSVTDRPGLGFDLP